MTREVLESKYLGVPVLVEFKDANTIYKGVIYKTSNPRYDGDLNFVVKCRKNVYCLEYTEPKKFVGDWGYIRLIFRVSHIHKIKIVEDSRLEEVKFEEDK